MTKNSSRPDPLDRKRANVDSTNGRGSHTDWAVRRLRMEITEGNLKPDDPLRAPQLAEQWGMSPTPIREAFQRLAASGFLTYSSHHGVRVAPISLEELEELGDLRILVEPPALRRSMENASDTWLGDVEAALESLQRAHAADPFVFPDYEEAHHNFHVALVSCAGPTWWPRVTTMLLDQAARYRSFEVHQRDFDQLMREHKTITRSCSRGDVAAAVKQLERHIIRGRRVYELVA